MARNWEALGSSQRHRYEAHGITRAHYESGGSLTAGRGHKNTPEHPERAELPRNQSKYEKYIEKRRQLENKVEAKKEAIFNSSRFNSRRSSQNVKRNPAHHNKPAKMSYLKAFLEDDFDTSDIDWADDEWGFLYYK
jgi:hypothetical protein